MSAWLSDAALDHLREVADRPTSPARRYELAGRRSAAAAWATVYLARDRELDREVALKVLDGAGPRTPERRAHGCCARRASWRAWSTPGSCRSTTSGVLPDGRVFYVMKLVRGRRLDELAPRRPPLPERLRVFERICEAVAFAHAHGVIHRDLKPENVMVGPFGEVLVMDWGVAKLLGDAGIGPRRGTASRAAGTAHGTVLGTPGYMAPEQARGEVTRDRRAQPTSTPSARSSTSCSTCSPPPRGPADARSPRPAGRRSAQPRPWRRGARGALRRRRGAGRRRRARYLAGLRRWRPTAKGLLERAGAPRRALPHADPARPRLPRSCGRS